jgi:hypothetical protein
MVTLTFLQSVLMAGLFSKSCWKADVADRSDTYSVIKQNWKNPPSEAMSSESNVDPSGVGYSDTTFILETTKCDVNEYLVIESEINAVMAAMKLKQSLGSESEDGMLFILLKLRHYLLQLTLSLSVHSLFFISNTLILLLSHRTLISALFKTEHQFFFDTRESSHERI